jgi:RecB family exonuclease
MLKATLSSCKVERLCAGPEASVGTLVHRVLERTWGNSSADVDSVFESEYLKITKELEADRSRAHFQDLASTRTLTQWAALRAWIRARSLRGGLYRRTKSGGPLPDKGLGAEQKLESKGLRLRGRADRVRRLGPSELEVRDFKSGATLDSEGQIKADIALQLKAYGLMLLELNPLATIRLVVDDGEERELEFGQSERDAARELLVKLISDLPPPGSALARALATPGASCWGCSYRHRCSAYLEIAPSWWLKYPSETDRIPLDIWGVVTELSRTEPGFSVRLQDQAGRRVRIDSLDERHGISADDVSRPMYLFGLEATGPSRDFDGRPYHPRSFHERPRDRLERRAWTATAFTGVTDGDRTTG